MEDENLLMNHKHFSRYKNAQTIVTFIRQIIYSLYRSKNLSKTVYNHLINSI